MLTFYCCNTPVEGSETTGRFAVHKIVQPLLYLDSEQEARAPGVYFLCRKQSWICCKCEQWSVFWPSTKAKMYTFEFLDSFEHRMECEACEDKVKNVVTKDHFHTSRWSLKVEVCVCLRVLGGSDVNQCLHDHQGSFTGRVAGILKPLRLNLWLLLLYRATEEHAYIVDVRVTSYTSSSGHSKTTMDEQFLHTHNSDWPADLDASDGWRCSARDKHPKLFKLKEKQKKQQLDGRFLKSNLTESYGVCLLQVSFLTEDRPESLLCTNMTTNNLRQHWQPAVLALPVCIGLI